MAQQSVGEALLVVGAVLGACVLTVPLVIVLINWLWSVFQLAQSDQSRPPRTSAIVSRVRSTAPAPPFAELPPPPATVVVRRVQRVARPAELPPLPAIRRHAPVVVSPNQPLWQEKGWRPATATAYTGEFQAAGRRWRGQIESPYPGAYQAFIWRPPLRELDMHPHRACFQRNGHGPDCYYVHYSTMPNSLDHAITTVEQVLAEALTRYK